MEGRPYSAKGPNGAVRTGCDKTRGMSCPLSRKKGMREQNADDTAGFCLGKERETPATA